MRRQRAGTEDSVYPSEEYMRTLSGRVFRAGAGADDEGLELELELLDGSDCVRDGGGGGDDDVEVGYEAESVRVGMVIAGRSDVTEDDHLRGPEFKDGRGGADADGGGGRINGVGVGTCSTRSRNVTTGTNAFMTRLQGNGELGNGRWITAFAFGGGRIGISHPPPKLTS